MATSEIIYLDQLRTKAVHLASQNEILTDAPLDNHGRGETFSPTDLLATSVASCMLTVMGIYADRHKLNLGKVTALVTKIMASNPRRVSEIQIKIRFPENKLSPDQREELKKTAVNCPVALSIHPDIKKHFSFEFE